MALTDEDKRWISAQLHTLDAKIDQVANRLDAKIDQVENRLDTKIEKFHTTLDAKIDQVEKRFDAKIDQAENRLDAKIERVETALLTEFHKWASPHATRQRSHTLALSALDLDVEDLKDRVKRLEDQRPH